MLVNRRFHSLIPSLSGSTVSRWFMLSIHTMGLISEVTRIWCYRLASSGVSYVKISDHISVYFFHNVLVFFKCLSRLIKTHVIMQILGQCDEQCV